MPHPAGTSIGVIHPDFTLLDYGYGHGDDIRTVLRLGNDTIRWDPVCGPHGELRTSEVMNLGYVANVIEDPTREDGCPAVYRAPHHGSGQPDSPRRPRLSRRWGRAILAARLEG